MSSSVTTRVLEEQFMTVLERLNSFVKQIRISIQAEHCAMLKPEEHVRMEVPCDVLYAESKGLKIDIYKTETMVCAKTSETATIRYRAGPLFKETETLKYLGSVMNAKGDAYFKSHIFTKFINPLISAEFIDFPLLAFNLLCLLNLRLLTSSSADHDASMHHGLQVLVSSRIRVESKHCCLLRYVVFDDCN